MRNLERREGTLLPIIIIKLIKKFSSL